MNDPKHRRAMGGAVWLYLYLMMHAKLKPEGDLLVDQVRRKYEKISSDLEMSVRTVQGHMEKLKLGGYIDIRREQYSMVITIKNGQGARASRTAKSGGSGDEYESEGEARPAEIGDSATPSPAGNGGSDESRSASLCIQIRKFVHPDPQVCVRPAGNGVSVNSGKHNGLDPRPAGNGVSLKNLEKNFETINQEEEEATSSSPEEVKGVGKDMTAEESARYNEFRDYAKRTHLRIRGAEVLIHSKEINLVAWMVKKINLVRLKLAWWLFLKEQTGWLGGRPARTIPMFHAVINDYLSKAGALLAARRARLNGTGKKLKTGGGAMIIPKLEGFEVGWSKCRAVLEKEMIPENFSTWLEPIKPLGVAA